MQTCSRCQNTLTSHNTLSRHRVCLACSWPRYSLAPLNLDPDDYACPKCRVQIIRIILKER